MDFGMIWGPTGGPQDLIFQQKWVALSDPDRFWHPPNVLPDFFKAFALAWQPSGLIFVCFSTGKLTFSSEKH